MNEDNTNTSFADHVSLARFRRRFRQAIEEWVRSWVINLLQHNIIASVDSSTGTPSVTPTYDPNTGKLTFVFTGLKGGKGDDGTSIRILSTFASSSELNSVTNPQLGDGYLIDGYLWAYLESTEAGSVNGFKNIGKVQGPAGDGLNFNWNGTSLGIKNESDDSYSPSNYVDLKGADGTKWHTINSSSQLIGTTANTDYSTTLIASCKAGDYCLNAYYDYVYECQSVSVSGNTTTSIWHYKGNIKGSQGVGLQFRWANNGTVLEVKRTTDSSWSSSGNLKGQDGNPGAPGSIVSKAYRFQPDMTGHSYIFGGGEWVSAGKDAFADARITINQDTQLANVHLTMITQLVMISDWDETMGRLGAYENGCSWIGILDPTVSYLGEYKVNEVYLPDNPNIANIGVWYGSIIIRHPSKWVAGQQIKETGPVLIDLHGVFSAKVVDFDHLFVNGMQYHLCMT